MTPGQLSALGHDVAGQQNGCKQLHLLGITLQALASTALEPSAQARANLT